MVLAFLFVYFGIRSYRDTVAGGSLSFGRAMKVGSLIALIASCCYVATWEVMYFKFMPDFTAKMTAHTVAKARAAGESEEAVAKKQQEMAEFWKEVDVILMGRKTWAVATGSLAESPEAREVELEAL